MIDARALATAFATACATALALTCIGCKADEASAPPPPTPPTPEAPAPSAPAEPPAPSAAPGATGGQPASPAPVALGEGTPEQQQALERAHAALDAGDTAAALTAYTEAADGPITGTSVSALLAAAELYGALERPAEARSHFERAVEQAPEVAEIRFAAGRHYAGAGLAPLAATELREAIRLQPDFLPAYPALAGVLSQTGQGTAAAELLATYEVRLQQLTARLANAGMPDRARVDVIDLFALVDDDRVTHALISALTAQSAHVRLAAADALTHDPAPEALTALAQAVEAERDPIARRALAASMMRAKATIEASLGQKAPPPPMPKPGQ